MVAISAHRPQEKAKPGEPIKVASRPSRWDEIALEGDIAAKDFLVRYKRGGRTVAVASIFRDAQSLEAEVNFERRRLA